MSEFFKRYFIEQDEIPPGTVRWQLFGWQHFVWLGLLAVLAVLFTVLFRKANEKSRRKLELWTGLSLVGLDIIRYAFLLLKGHFSVGYLPLHLCGMSVYLEAICAAKPNKLLRELIWAVSMPGALMALITPDWTMYEPFVFYPTICFLIHIMLVVYPIMLVAGGRHRPDWRNLWKCLAFLAAVSVPIYFINKAWGTDFMFLNWAPRGTPLAWFERLWGTPGYILCMPILLAALWLVMYSPLALYDALRTKRAPAENRTEK